MSGISRITAYAIQNNPELTITTGKEKPEDTWTVFLWCIDAQGRLRPLLDLKTQTMKENEAHKAMIDLVDEVKGWHLNDTREVLATPLEN